MKILFNMGSLQKGGAERVATNLCNYLVNNNDISIVTTIKAESAYPLDEKVKVYNLDDNKPNSNFIIKNIKRIRALNKVIKEIEPDTIVSFLPEPSYRVLFLKIFNRKLKIIVSVRNDPKIEYASKINKIVMRVLYSLADGFVFQTKEAKEYFSKKIQERSVIIPNSINEEFINADISNEKQNIIVNVGRLEEQKNQELLIKAFIPIAKKYDYKLIIYGEGNTRKKLETLVKENDLEEKVFLQGNTDNIKEKLNEAQIFVLTSKYEGMPNALMEAMAMGLACISTDCPCGGPKFLIKNNYNGILVDNDINILSETIENLIIDENKRKKIAKNAVQIREKLNPDKINNEWKKYIEKNKGES